MEEIDKAIAMAQKLRSLLIQVIAIEKEWTEYEGSSEKMLDTLGTFNEAADADNVPAVDLLAQIDQILYSLMDYGAAGEGWHDEDEYSRREVLKLKEIIARDNQFKLREILLASAA